MDGDVPVGLQAMACHARLRATEGTPPELLQKLQTPRGAGGNASDGVV